MGAPKLYVDDGFDMKRVRLSDDAYGDAIGAMVIYCVDAVFINRERRTLFLARRQTQPFIGWWVVGGRVYVGESDKVAAVRKIRQETGLEVSEDRLSHVRGARFFWRHRAQEPQDAGCDSFGQIYSVEVTDDEVALAAMNLDPVEYDTAAGMREFTREELVAIGAHQAMIDHFDAIFAPRRRPYLRLLRRRTRAE